MQRKLAVSLNHRNEPSCCEKLRIMQAKTASLADGLDPSNAGTRSELILRQGRNMETYPS